VEAIPLRPCLREDAPMINCGHSPGYARGTQPLSEPFGSQRDSICLTDKGALRVTDNASWSRLVPAWSPRHPRHQAH
jgi:hypothetical protein